MLFGRKHTDGNENLFDDSFLVSGNTPMSTV